MTTCLHPRCKAKLISDTEHNTGFCFVHGDGEYHGDEEIHSDAWNEYIGDRDG